MKETILKATTQRSYYGKAAVIDNEDGTKALRSYETIVCTLDPETGKFTRLWGGWSRTTSRHVNDFRRLFGLPALSKKEWESLPVSGPTATGERYKVAFTNGFVSWVANTIFDSASAAWDFAEKVMETRNYTICADVIEA